jgi:dissimilatory sulfite reductase (desulfoviridin) alpha/beta subunit
MVTTMSVASSEHPKRWRKKGCTLRAAWYSIGITIGGSPGRTRGRVNKLWSTLAVLDYDEVQSATEGVLDLHVRVSDSNLLMLSRVAVVMLADGWRLYDRQRSPAY